MVSFTRKVDTNPSLGILGDVASADDINELQQAIEDIYPNFAAKTANYTAVAADKALTFDCSGGARTLTLPTAASMTAGKAIWVSKIDTSVNALTLDGAGSETIDDLLSIVLYGRVSVVLMATSSGWAVVSGKAFINPLALHPQWFGAKLDNSTDDTTALQAWINASITSGRKLGLPRGSSVARVTDTMTVGTAQGQRLDMDGSGGTVQVIYDGANSKSVFKLQGLKQSSIRGINIRVNATRTSDATAITGVTGWEVSADSTYTSTSFVTWENCSVDLGTGGASASAGKGWYIHDDGASRDISFLQWHNCFVHGQGRAEGDVGWTVNAPNGLNFSWFGGSAQGVDTAVDISASVSGEAMFFYGFGTSGTNVDFKVPRYGNIGIYGGRFELGKVWISGATGLANIQHITALGCDVSGYTPADDCVILLGGATTLLLDNCFIRNTTLTPYTAAFITVNANVSALVSLLVRGGAIQADDPFYTVTNGIVKLGVESVRRLSSSSVASGWFQDRPNGVSQDNGDSAKTLTAGLSSHVQRWATPLTANRAAALSTTGAFNGARFHVVREATATGAFTLQVGTGPLKALAAGEWCKVAWNGSAWMLTSFGSL